MLTWNTKQSIATVHTPGVGSVISRSRMPHCEDKRKHAKVPASHLRTSIVSSTRYRVHFPLHYAAKVGDLSTVQNLLQTAAVNVNGVDTQLNTPLHVACYYGQVAIVRWLLTREDIQLNQRDQYGRTALHHCCRGAQRTATLTCAQALVSHRDVILDMTDTRGQTPLFKAVQYLRTDLLNLFLCMGANSNVQDDELLMTPLHYAVALRQHTRKHCRRQRHPHALTEASRRETVPPDHSKLVVWNQIVACVRLLLQHRASVNVQDVHGDTPLHTLISHLHVCYDSDTSPESVRVLQQLVSVLLAQPNVDVTVVNQQGHTPVTLAATLLSSRHAFGSWLSMTLAKHQETHQLEALVQKGIHSWSTDDVARWLVLVGYSEHVPAFRANHVDGLALVNLCQDRPTYDKDNAEDPLKTELLVSSFSHRIDLRNKVKALMECQVNGSEHSLMGPITQRIQSDSRQSPHPLPSATLPTDSDSETSDSGETCHSDKLTLEAFADKHWQIDYLDLEFGEVVGKGYFGEVRRGTWKGIQVALKYIYRDLQKTKEKQMFLKEIAILSKLRHPNIINLLGWSRVSSLSSTSDSSLQPDTATVVMVLEYMSGGTLYHVVRHSFATLANNSALQWRILLDIVKGMTYLHSRGILHRDLNTKNLLLTEHWTCKISDFGLSRFWRPEDAHTAMTTHVGFLVTMAPEVFTGESYTQKVPFVFSCGHSLSLSSVCGVLTKSLCC
jgi:ankyrin repeat protein